jgi:hypothetical protein
VPDPDARPGRPVDLDPQPAGQVLAAIDALDRGVRGGPEPESVTLEAYGREIPEA